RAVIEKTKKSGNGEDVKYIRNVLIDSPEKLAKIKRSNIKFLFIDTAKARKIELPPEEEKPKEVEKPEPIVEKIEEPEPEPEPEEEMLDSFDEDSVKKPKIMGALVPFDEELEQAREVKTAAVSNVKNMLENVAAGKSFETEEAKKDVNGMVKSIFRNKDALLSLTRLKSFDEYTFTHSVNVTVLSIALAQDLGFTKEEINQVGFGGMVHDIGKMLVPDEVLNKPGKLTPDERVIIQKHTTFGKELLEKRGDIPEVAIRMAWEHHEKINGSGYPEGKTKDQLQKESMVTSVADVYDALTSARVYKPGMPPPQALSFIKSKCDTEFNTEYTDKFLETIGIYPIGSVVEFNSGQIGIVNEVNRDDLFKPTVLMVLNNKKQKVAPRIIEPSRYDPMELKIIRYHDPDMFEIVVEEYLDVNQKRI
ncbi:HD-GYP domain-containing protein, partial [candidate division KSB1 bacterium]